MCFVFGRFTAGTVSREVNSGFGVCCAIQTLETCIDMIKIFLNLNVIVLRSTEQHDQSNFTERNYPRDPPIKNMRINYDSILELYYYVVTGARIRDTTTKNNFAGIYGVTVRGMKS